MAHEYGLSTAMGTQGLARSEAEAAGPRSSRTDRHR